MRINRRGIQQQPQQQQAATRDRTRMAYYLSRIVELEELLQHQRNRINQIDLVVRDVCEKFRDSRIFTRSLDEKDEFDGMDLCEVARQTWHIMEDYNSQQTKKYLDMCRKADQFCREKEILKEALRNILISNGNYDQREATDYIASCLLTGGMYHD